MEFQELEYIGGAKALVQSPPTVKKVRGEFVFVWSQVRYWQDQLLKQASTATKNHWPPIDADSICYSRLSPIYSAIAELMGIERVQDLDPVSRHTFFVCTGPNEEGKLGFSRLEQLMHIVEGEEQGQEPLRGAGGITSGDEIVDILAMSLLVFKRNGMEVAQMLSPGVLAKAVIFANEKLKPPDDGEKKRQRRTDPRAAPAPIATRPANTQFDEEMVAAALLEKGIVLPREV